MTDILSQEQNVQKTPARRCVTCRGNGKKYGLLRFVVFQNTLCFDLRQKLPGRGFYVCAQRPCLEKAFANGLKRMTKHEPAELAQDLASFIHEIVVPGFRKRYTELLLAGYQSHQLLLGADAVEHAAQSDELACYLIASDASASTSQKYRTNAGRKGLECRGLLDRAEYGRLFGKTEKVIMGWLPGRLHDEFALTEDAILRLDEENCSVQSKN